MRLGVHLPQNELGDDAAAVRDFAQAAGLALVAEGVEDAATARALAKMRGVIGQGYYFGKPLPANEVRHYAASRAAVWWPGRRRAAA